jgi:hypothetical protein
VPRAPANKTPILKSKLPSNCYVFTWDARLSIGYLLAAPRSRDEDELRFTIDWRDQQGP